MVQCVTVCSPSVAESGELKLCAVGGFRAKCSNMMARGLLRVNRCFEGRNGLRHRGRRISQTRNQDEAGSKEKHRLTFNSS
jgi:hypothetical protein